jgi:putative hydrolase of the HAD superfamily
MPAAPAVTFFDLDTLLALAAGRVPRVRRAARRRLSGAARAGVLANIPVALGAAGIEQTLVVLGIDGWFEKALIIDAARLSVAMPDRRVFALAAALAEVPPADCLYLTTSAAHARAARAAGMRAEIERAPGAAAAAEVIETSPAGPQAEPAGLAVL